MWFCLPSAANSSINPFVSSLRCTQSFEVRGNYFQIRHRNCTLLQSIHDKCFLQAKEELLTLCGGQQVTNGTVPDLNCSAHKLWPLTSQTLFTRFLAHPEGSTRGKCPHELKLLKRRVQRLSASWQPRGCYKPSGTGRLQRQHSGMLRSPLG